LGENEQVLDQNRQIVSMGAFCLYACVFYYRLRHDEGDNQPRVFIKYALESSADSRTVRFYISHKLCNPSGLQALADLELILRCCSGLIFCRFFGLIFVY
jgi:hypothetical protein